MRRLFGRSLFRGVVLLQLAENLNFIWRGYKPAGQTHYEESIGEETPEMRSLWKVTSMICCFKKNRLRRILNPTPHARLVSAAVFRKTKGTEHSPRCYRGHVAPGSEARNSFCRLSQTPILEPSRISGFASGPWCAAEVISVSLRTLSLAQGTFLLS